MYEFLFYITGFIAIIAIAITILCIHFIIRMRRLLNKCMAKKVMAYGDLKYELLTDMPAGVILNIKKGGQPIYSIKYKSMDELKDMIRELEEMINLWYEDREYEFLSQYHEQMGYEKWIGE